MSFAVNAKTPLRIGNVVTLVLVVVLGAQLAWWGWHFLGPQADTGVPALPAPVDPAAARTLLGGSADDVAAPSSASAPSAADTGGIRLKGVFAVDGKTLSAAIVNTGSRDMSVRVNEAISDGVKLVEVRPDAIVISRGGARETIAMDKMGSKAATNAGASTAAAAQTGFRLKVNSTAQNSYSLSRTELNNVLQDPNQVNHLGVIAPTGSGGVQVKEAPQGSLMQKLGLQAGDIITSLNGQPVSGPGDLARLYGQFGQISSIRAEVRRGGAPLSLSYSITQ